MHPSVTTIYYFFTVQRTFSCPLAQAEWMVNLKMQMRGCGQAGQEGQKREYAYFPKCQTTLKLKYKYVDGQES